MSACHLKPFVLFSGVSPLHEGGSKTLNRYLEGIPLLSGRYFGNAMTRFFQTIPIMSYLQI
jgi:hypothetical protein